MKQGEKYFLTNLAKGYKVESNKRQEVAIQPKSYEGAKVMTMQKVIRHKHYVLAVIAENCNCMTVTNRQGKIGIWYPKKQKLVFRTSTGKMASI